MKRISLFLAGLLVILLFFSACSDGMSEVQPSTLKQIVITASDFEIEDKSRTSFLMTSEGAEFSWAANDTIGIFPNEGAQAYFPMVSGAGTKSANFTGGGWALKDASMYAAYYPFIGDFYLNKNSIPVDYAGQVQTGDNSTAHLGSYDYMAAIPESPTNGSVNFSFRHLEALVQLRLTMPEPTTINTVTLTTESEAFAVKGKVDIMTSNPEITPTITSNELTLQVKDVITTEVNQIVTLYVMIPPVDLSAQTLKAVVSTNQGSKEVLLESKNFLAGKAYTLTGMFEGEFMPETDYVDLKFGMPNVSVIYNENDGSLTVTYLPGDMPNVRVGNSIVLPAEYGFDIRVIESVATSGNTLRLTTSQGNMSNLFRNINFTLTTEPEVVSRVVNSNVYTPVAYGYVGEDGKYHEIYNESRAVYPIENFEWKGKIDFNGEKIYEGKAGTVRWDKCEFSAGLKGTFTFNFGEKTIDEVRAVGDLKRIDYQLTGNVDMDMLLHYKYEYEYKESGDEIIKHNVIPTGIVRFEVPIGIVRVPLVLLIYTHLGKMYACQIEGKLDATTGVRMGNEVSVGLEWTPEGGAKPFKEVKPYFEFYPLTVRAEASAEAKVSFYPQWEIGLYKFKAIWLEPRPYLKEKVEAGFRASTDGDNYIAWKAETYNGMDFRMGLETEFGFWRKDIWTSDIYNVVKDRLLFEAPSRIRTLSPENNIMVDKDENVKAEFIVESFSPITSKYYPCPWALVNFEPESGKLDKSLVVTDVEGKAIVGWIPNPDNSLSAQTRTTELVDCTLKAKIVDKEGKSIDEAGLVVNIEKANTEEPKDELREALIKLYKSTNGDNWTRNDNWCSDLPVSEWYGVYIIDDYCSINLSNNNLTGEICQTFPNNLEIDYLSLDYNQLVSINLSGCRSLKHLHCGANQLTSLDVSGCEILEYLSYTDGNLSSLNASGCVAMEDLSCENNQLASLDVSGCVALKDLSCDNNLLTSLDVSGCVALEFLNCYNNQLTSLLTVNCPVLKEIKCSNNQLMSLNVLDCEILESLSCENNQLITLDLSRCTYLGSIECNDNQLVALDFSNCPNLVYLTCCNNLLTSLDVSHCSVLNNIQIYNNKLIHLDVSKCTDLEVLRCYNNNLLTLDASGCVNLENIYCNNNQLTSIDVSGCIDLRRLDCYENQLTTLDVSGCINLESLSCEHNKILGEIPDYFSCLQSFTYDVRYRYWQEVINDVFVTKYADNGVGWWYPGEPQKGYHGL